MECEICGRNVSNLHSITMYGSEMLVCSNCRSRNMQSTQRKKLRKVIRRSKNNYEELNLVDFYGLRIRVARENKGLTREQLAKELNERESLLRRIEAEKTIPEDRLVEKLEKFLGIKLRKNNAEKKPSKAIDRPKEKLKGTAKLTLADILKMQMEAKQ